MRSTHVDFISINGRTQKRAAVRLNCNFVEFEFRLHRQEIETGLCAAFFGAEGIRNDPPKHLVSATDTQHPAAMFESLEQNVSESPIEEPTQISDGILGAGNDDQIHGPRHPNLAQIFQRYSGHAIERIEVGVIRNMRQPDNTDSKRTRPRAMVLERDAVFLVDVQTFDEWQHAETPPPRAFLQEFRPAGEQFQIAAKTIDDETADEVAFFIFKKRECSDDRGENSAAVDVRNKECARSDGFGKRQVHNIAIFEIHLSRAAGTFHDDHVESRREPVKAFKRLLEEERLALVVFVGRHRSVHPAVQDNLNLSTSRWLQQDWIHVRFGFDARSFGLCHLSPANFAAVATHKRIQRHVLRLEWRHTHATLLQEPAQRGHKNALPRVRSCPNNHQTAFHRSPVLARISGRKTDKKNRKVRTTMAFSPSEKSSQLCC